MRLPAGEQRGTARVAESLGPKPKKSKKTGKGKSTVSQSLSLPMHVAADVLETGFSAGIVVLFKVSGQDEPVRHTAKLHVTAGSLLVPTAIEVVRCVSLVRACAQLHTSRMDGAARLPSHHVFSPASILPRIHNRSHWGRALGGFQLCCRRRVARATIDTGPSVACRSSVIQPNVHCASRGVCFDG